MKINFSNYNELYKDISIRPDWSNICGMPGIITENKYMRIKEKNTPIIYFTPDDIIKKYKFIQRKNKGNKHEEMYGKNWKIMIEFTEKLKEQYENL